MDNTNDFRNKIDKYENDLLESYNDLIVNYEDSRQLYEKTMKEYEKQSSNTEFVKCSSIVGYNYDPNVIKWQIIALDQSEIYLGSSSLQYETWTCDLDEFSLIPGTLFQIKVLVTSKDDHFANETFQYEPSSSTIYYEYTKDNSQYVVYNGLIPSNTKPPILKCSTIAAKHIQYGVIMRFKILNALNGTVLDSSVKTTLGDTWNYSLSNLGLPAGTLLKLRAAVTGGADSTAYVILEYDPTSTDTANFGFYGNAFRTVVPYKG